MKNKDEGVGIAFLTELGRDEWANARSYLSELNLRNRGFLTSIETAVVCVAIPEDDIQVRSTLPGIFG